MLIHNNNLAANKKSNTNVSNKIANYTLDNPTKIKFMVKDNNKIEIEPVED
ncbi:MAG TPA: hypothetical protein VJ697_16170 [Nitrososphaeraceae archaeon]|nr:hypothetical protein [Nitrososphaeraceae archaeon]